MRRTRRQAIRLAGWTAGMFLLLFLFCAKKMLPPSPDRFSPRLVEINPRSRVEVELVFNEDIDPAQFFPESLHISELAVRGVSRGRDGTRVIVWTEPQQPRRYTISGVVWDIAGNPGRFRGGFTGSPRVDTIAPRVVSVSPAPGSTGLFRSIRINVRFSEPVDTLLPLDYMIIPGEYETLFLRSWSADWRDVNFVCRESIGPELNCYFLLQPGVKDLEGNSSSTPAWTFWTTDSVFDGVRARGRAVIEENGERLNFGTVFFHQDATRAVAPILSDGSFELKLRAGDYSVVGVGDRDGDGVVDLISLPVEFNTQAESLTLFFVPESVPRRINEYRR